MSTAAREILSTTLRTFPFYVSVDNQLRAFDSLTPDEQEACITRKLKEES